MKTEAFREEMIRAGAASQTDKIAEHHYENVYSKYLHRFKHSEPLAILEIGFGSGSGIEFWKAIFPEAFIYCFDRDHEGEADRVKIVKADQSELKDLQQAVMSIDHPINLIIDDGSHHPSHQLLTFSYLFQEVLQPGGTYSIEDIETSYWRNGILYGYMLNYGLNDPWSAVEAFKLAADFVNHRFLSDADKSLLQYRMMSIGLDPQAGEQIENILFSRNCILIDKNTQLEESSFPYLNAAATRRFQ